MPQDCVSRKEFVAALIFVCFKSYIYVYDWHDTLSRRQCLAVVA